MIQKIEDKTIMTSSEAREKYNKHYIGFVTTKQDLENFDRAEGYVVYIVDTYKEKYEVPRSTDDGHYIFMMTGYATGSKEVGGIYIDD